MSEIRRLMEVANQQQDVGVSTVDFEDSFERVLDYIKRHPEVRETAEALFIEALDWVLDPWELIAFCMHELRWQSVRDAVETRLALSRNQREKPILRSILEAFEDDWVDRVLYAYYGRPR